MYGNLNLITYGLWASDTAPPGSNFIIPETNGGSHIITEDGKRMVTE